MVRAIQAGRRMHRGGMPETAPTGKGLAMDEKDWLILKTLHEKRNITKTAAAVHISQPALSKRLQQIEERFGVRVAVRGKSGVELTPAGEYLAACSHEILNRMRSIGEHINNLGDEVKGTLRIGASYFCTKYALPDVLMRFKEQYPEVEFHLQSSWSSDVFKKLRAGDIHVAFIRNEMAGAAERYLLFRERTYICSRKELDLACLPEEPHIQYHSDPLVRADLEAWWNDHYTDPPRVAMVVDRVDSAVDMVLKGLGYSFFSEFMVKQMPAVHRYEMRRLSGEHYYRNTWVIPNKAAKQLKIVQRFVEFVADFRYGDALDSLHPRDADTPQSLA